MWCVLQQETTLIEALTDEAKSAVEVAQSAMHHLEDLRSAGCKVASLHESGSQPSRAASSATPAPVILRPRRQRRRSLLSAWIERHHGRTWSLVVSSRHRFDSLPQSDGGTGTPRYWRIGSGVPSRLVSGPDRAARLFAPVTICLSSGTLTAKNGRTTNTVAGRSWVNRLVRVVDSFVTIIHNRDFGRRPLAHDRAPAATDPLQFIRRGTCHRRSTDDESELDEASCATSRMPRG